MVGKQVHEGIPVITENVKEHHKNIQAVVHIQFFPHGIKQEEAEKKKKQTNTGH